MSLPNSEANFATPAPASTPAPAPTGPPSAKPTAEDPIGHQANLETLIQRLNSNCNQLIASVECYACVSTFPLTSEILVEYTLNGEEKETVIDLYTPENDILRFHTVHLPTR